MVADSVCSYPSLLFFPLLDLHVACWLTSCPFPCYFPCIAFLGAGIYISGTVTDCSDTQNSRLRFSGKAILHSEGVDFSSGQSFSLRLSDLLPQEELGKGNYGTVVHVIHRVTNAHMAMKQIKLELDNSKFMAIITELQVHIPFPGSFTISCLRRLPVLVIGLFPCYCSVDGLSLVSVVDRISLLLVCFRDVG